jgi:transcriptional regulator with XRE-family HTH domain
MENKVVRKNKERIYGNKIKIILKSKGMSQQELASLSGIQISHLSKIILGKRMCVSLPIAFKIAIALKEPIEDIFLYKKPVKLVNNEEGD